MVLELRSLYKDMNLDSDIVEEYPKLGLLVFGQLMQIDVYKQRDYILMNDSQQATGAILTNEMPYILSLSEELTNLYDRVIQRDGQEQAIEEEIDAFTEFLQTVYNR